MYVRLILRIKLELTRVISNGALNLVTLIIT